MGPASRIILSLCLVLAAPAFADDEAPGPNMTRAPPGARAAPADGGRSQPAERATKEDRTLESFGAHAPTCQEWTDGCAVCTRVAAGATACSLPGIACLPTAITCRREGAPKPPDMPAQGTPEPGKDTPAAK